MAVSDIAGIAAISASASGAALAGERLERARPALALRARAQGRERGVDLRLVVPGDQVGGRQRRLRVSAPPAATIGGPR